MASDRDHQYPPRRDGFAADPGYRSGPPAQPPERYPPPREEYASDQVKDLLELYFRDPQAFDQYAKTYYYGERMERARAGYVAAFVRSHAGVSVVWFILIFWCPGGPASYADTVWCRDWNQSCRIISSAVSKLCTALLVF